MILKHVAECFRNSDEFTPLRRWSNGPLSIEGVPPSSGPIIASSLFLEKECQVVVVTENSQKMNDTYLDITCFIDESLVTMLPSWETLPYEFVSPPLQTERERITALYKILSGSPCIIVTTVESLMRKLPDKSYFIKRGVTLKKDDEYPFDDLAEMLVSYGYRREPRVDSYGQFSVKGGIIDIFLPSMENPVRLDFFGDTLESIREFDLNSQISQSRLDSITIYPEKELVLFEKEKKKLYDILKDAVSKGLDLGDEIDSLLEKCSASGGLEPLQSVRGLEDLFPMLIQSATLDSYLNDGSLFVFIETPELLSKKRLLEKYFNELYEKKKSHTLALPPVELLTPEAFESALNRGISIQAFLTSNDSAWINIKSIPSFSGRINEVRSEISDRVLGGWRVIVTTSFEGQARRLYDLLAEFRPGSDFENMDPGLGLNILIMPLREGIEINHLKILIITDHEIFGKSYRKKKQFKKKKSRPIDSFLDLELGDYVVHINQGIGIFRGIERMSAGGVFRDFLHIEYAGSDKLYVSLDQISMVQKYIGMEGRKPKVDSLGKKSAWNRIKQKVQETVDEIARELMDIYSRRSALKGYQYPPDTVWQEEFESKFEYEETPDQISAIEDVKDDMESPKPMDRLICGDVGFGKTEVAIRASFKAVMAGRQVAILAPTTILVMQHFLTFTKRFRDYPIEVDMISRFRSRGEISEIGKKLAAGRIDIIIGTHALLSKEISIKNLGLLIIDEEQKFGVRHKEQMKKLRSTLDVLTLSATPIPRTLHMSVAGIRDLSVISTPPENRQSINAYVLEENPDILREAILTEIKREGQVFFVHNRVSTIDSIHSALKKLVPEATCCVAHGQMDADELEGVMIDFINREYDVLICTAIIESGLDMPNVNTIIVNRADTFGLSQLYQLKGRVGRSERKAYSYMFYPRHMNMTEEAQKRLQVISEYTELGSGFKIAMKDLEIRGAGNILGREQSGCIMDVGFDLYCQMLDNTMRHLKGEKTSINFRTPVFIKSDFYIPSEYINDEKQKIEFYKRFEACESPDEVDQLALEMKDRFGEPPQQVYILIETEKIRALATALLIDEIIEETGSIRIKITGQSRVERSRILPMITTDIRFTIDPVDNEKLNFHPESAAPEKKLMELKKWLQQIS